MTQKYNIKSIFIAMNHIIFYIIVKSPNDLWLKNNIKSIINAKNYIVFYIAVNLP